MKALIGILIALIGVIGIIVVNYFSAASTGNRLINNIESAYENNQNILSRVTLTITELAQIPGMQAEDMKSVVTAALDARYGEDGSKAMMQFITEQNPQITSDVYTKIQQAIESGRKDFEAAQTRMIDQKRVFNTAVGAPWKGIWMRAAGYSKSDVDEFEIVIDSSTEKAFETGKQEAIKLR
jgi:hypothetical protein